eukprot:CAMPEP_0178405792 /NCGR_PEP_ID=MMETSP0689_2-20121128/18580_1 /TAXON_ID=160604 /ORGANISM="Amphidinium massartii, Strain CS-259" /LENGTH=72 /DNA_ID=CAMNT_0020026815 /DNA_START=137 /DNA_END=351 /DNA_ORIENTATION=-
MPVIAIMARRPLANSDAFFFSTPASSSGKKNLNWPKSPVAAVVPGDWSWAVSTKAQYKKIWTQPAAGTLEMA